MGDSLKDIWSKASHFSEKAQAVQHIPESTGDTLSQLASRLRRKAFFAFGLSPFWIACLLYFEHPLQNVLFSVLLLVYLLGGVLILRQSRIIYRADPRQSNVLEALRGYYQRIKHTLYLEEMTGLAMYPLALIAGYTVGNSVSGATHELNSSGTLIALAVILAVGIPLSYWATHKLNQLAFGNFLEYLKEKIKNLESVQ